MSNPLLQSGLIALIAICQLTSPAHAALETFPPEQEQVRLLASYAVVHDMRTGQPVCQISTAGRPELVPVRLVNASNQPSSPPLSQVRECEGSELNVIRRVAASAQEGPTQTAMVPLVLAATWGVSCLVGALAGAESVVFYERYLAPEGRRKGRILRQNQTIAGISGATASVYMTGLAQIFSGFPVGAAYELISSGGFGLFCGAIAGLGTYTVTYILNQQPTSASSHQVN